MENIQNRIIWALVIIGVVLLVAYYAETDTAEAPLQEVMELATSTPEVIVMETPVYRGVSTIRVPFVEVGALSGATSTDVVGCGDRLVFVTSEVEKTTQPLNASYRALFAASTTVPSGDIALSNEIANQADLSFVKATLQGATASVYLEGELVSNECADARVKAQIEATATQFPNINEVKTYLNDQEFDWMSFGDQKDA